MSSTPQESSANRQIARAAGTVMIAFVLSNLLGVLRQILATRAFGTTMPLDAFYSAIQVPDTLFNLIAGGALGSAFIPTFTSLLTHGDSRSAWRLASIVGNLIVLILALLSLAGSLFAPQIVRYILYAKDVQLDPAKFTLTVTLLRILMSTSVIFGASGLLMGILNAHQSFWLPALATSMYWLGMIFGVTVLAPWGIYGLAWGAVLGSALHLGIQLPGLLRLKERYYVPSIDLNVPAVREVARLMAPRLFGVAVVQLNFVLNIILANGMQEGSASAIATARMIWTMPEAVIAQAIAIAALPTFAALVARGSYQEMRSSLAATIRSVILLSLPASLGLMMLAKPLVAMLFQHGEFTELSTNLVAWALLWYAAGLVGHSIVEVMSRAFYALHDTRTPVLIGAAAMTLNLVFSLLFSALFSRVGWAPHGGLALANSLATALETVGLLVLMRRRLNGLEGSRMLSGLIQSGAAALGMGLALWGWLAVTAGQSTWLVTLGGVALGGVVYGALSLIFGVHEARSLVDIFSQRAKSYLQRNHIT